MHDRREIGHGMRDIVGECGAAIVDADAGIAGAEEEGAAGFEIVRLANCRFEIGGDQADGAMAVKIVAVIAIFVGRGLDRMNQRIEPGRGGDMRRHGDSEFGIENGDIGLDLLAPGPDLDLLRIGEDGDARYFRAGSGGGRDGDDRQAVLGQRHCSQLVGFRRVRRILRKRRRALLCPVPSRRQCRSPRLSCLRLPFWPPHRCRPPLARP